MSQNNEEHRIHNREQRIHNKEHRIHNKEHSPSFSYQCMLVIFCVAMLNKLILYYFYTIFFLFCVIFFLFKWLCWMVTVLWAVGMERVVVLDGNCAVGCGHGTDYH
jgi:hypothetical protein